jgi:hypothetical protein
MVRGGWAKLVCVLSFFQLELLNAKAEDSICQVREKNCCEISHLMPYENKDSVSGEFLMNLRQQYAINKKIPADLEKEILLSLSHYPELVNTRIKFCYAPLFTSMKAVPGVFFMFRKPENRIYRIVMNSRSCQGTTLMQRASPQALKGVLGHELGHIYDYSTRSNFQLLKLLAGYIFKGGRIATEMRADQFAIDHNLGKELVEFTEYIYEDGCMDPDYISYKKKYYNSPHSLRYLLQCRAQASF